MASDDLNAPLGQNKKKTLPKLPVAVPQLVAGILGLFGLLVLGWTIFVNDPLGGEPVVVVATKSPGTAPTQGDGKQHSRHEGETANAPDPAAASAAPKAAVPPPGSKTVTIIDGSSGKSKDVVIPGKASDNAPIEPTLLETTRHGAIPKIGPDGARASTLYAHPLQLAPSQKDFPRIAIVIGGLGISASGTADAFAKLPAPVTFALTPYGADVGKLAERARATNHEVLLQAPMEPFDYPDNDPGPQTLLTSITQEQNIDRLHWLMSRFRGYVGIINYMGARFTATEQAMAPILGETAKRGLIFVDDGSSTRSVASQLAGRHNLAFAKADIVLDTVPTPVEIDRALARLEITARKSGVAMGLATARPGTIDRIADWAKNIESRGFVLVPITNLAAKAKSS